MCLQCILLDLQYIIKWSGFHTLVFILCSQFIIQVHKLEIRVFLACLVAVAVITKPGLVLIVIR